jgi:hypothetical protein
MGGERGRTRTFNLGIKIPGIPRGFLPWWSNLETSIRSRLRFQLELTGKYLGLVAGAARGYQTKGTRIFCPRG